jgi:hypothetical protein
VLPPKVEEATFTDSLTGEPVNHRGWKKSPTAGVNDSE